VSLPIIAATIAFCVRHKRRKRRQNLTPQQVYFPAPDFERGVHPTGEKSGADTGVISREPGSPTETRQESLEAQLRVVQEQLAVLNDTLGNGGAGLQDAIRQNEALRERNRALERELYSLLEPESSDSSPPEYMD
jgi:hypothetical protein